MWVWLFSRCRFLSEIKRDSKSDPERSSLMEVILSGWPSNMNSCRLETLSFWRVSDQLSTADGLILMGTTLVPRSMRKTVLKKIHEGRMGIEKSRGRAREHIYCPGINVNITEMADSCVECQMYTEPIHQNHQSLMKCQQDHGKQWELMCFVMMGKTTS